MRTGHGRPVVVRLEEQEHKFALDKNKPVDGSIRITHINGQAVIEAAAENLRRGKSSYKLFLIGRKDGNSVYKIIGNMSPDKKGNAELRASVDPENVDGEGTELSCFYIFMMAAPGTPLQPVLKGDRVSRKERRDSTTAPITRKEYNTFYNEYIKQKTEDLIQSAEGFADISPFDYVWLARQWKRAADVMMLPVASAGAERQVGKYGHFIFAYDEDKFLLAVPGKHTAEEWPDRGASGFLMWQSIRKSEEYGYWCMVIERKTGIITEIS